MREFKINVDGKEYDVKVDEIDNEKFSVEFEKKKYTIKTKEINKVSEETENNETKLSGSNTVTAPIPGTVGKIKVKKGQKVKSDQVLITLIAMKMENEIKATKDGKIKEVHVKTGQNVDVGDILIDLD